MSNVLQALFHTIKSFMDDEEKTPLHIGEAMSCWTYLAGLKEAVGYEEAAINVTTDQELRDALEDGLKICRSQIKRVQEFMIAEGIPIPSAPDPKPLSDPQAVPMGARMSEKELANGVSVKVIASILACATGMSQSIRNDLGLMWIELQSEQLTFGATLKALMKKRGWLEVPPTYVPPGLPKQ